MNVTAFTAILQKELRSVLKERTIVIALLIQLFIASFSSAILMGLMSIYDPSSLDLSSYIRIRVGYVNELSPALEQAMLDYNVQLLPYETAEYGQEAYNYGQIDALLVTPEESVNAGINETLQIYLPASESQASIFKLILQEPLADYENNLREQKGVYLKYQELGGESAFTFEFRYGVIVPLLMFFPAFVCGGMVVDTIAEELVNHTLDTLWSGPLSLNTILLAKVSSAVIIAAGQVMLWTGLLRLNGIVIHRMVLVWLLAVISAAMVAVVSTLVALLFKDRERSQFIYALFILLTVSGSYMLDFSPVVLVTRLAAGDAVLGILHVGVYALLLGALWFVLSRISKRLVAAA